MWLCWVEAFTSHNSWTLGASVQVQLQHPASTWHAMPASTAIRIFSSGHVLLCPVGDTFKPSINLRRHMITSLKFFCEKNCIQGAALPFSPCIFMSYTPQVNLFNLPHMSLLAFIRTADAYRPSYQFLPNVTKWQHSSRALSCALTQSQSSQEKSNTLSVECSKAFATFNSYLRVLKQPGFWSLLWYLVQRLALPPVVTTPVNLYSETQPPKMNVRSTSNFCVSMKRFADTKAQILVTTQLTYGTSISCCCSTGIVSYIALYLGFKLKRSEM